MQGDKFKIMATEEDLFLGFKLDFKVVVEYRESMGQTQCTPLNGMVSKINGIYLLITCKFYSRLILPVN